jgi:hypothetical protein
LHSCYLVRVARLCVVLYDLPCLAGVAVVTTVPAQTPRRGDYKKTRKMAVGRYKDGNRVGAMAILAEQGGVTASIVATKE